MGFLFSGTHCIVCQNNAIYLSKCQLYVQFNSIQFTFISNNKVKLKIYKDDFPGNT